MSEPGIEERNIPVARYALRGEGGCSGRAAHRARPPGGA
jgi:hypothetical protein